MATEILSDEKGRLTCRLNAGDAAKVGMAVVYRLSPYSYPMLGHLSHRNGYADWQIGAWVVRDATDDRLYVLETEKGARWRAASEQDVAHYMKRAKGKPSRVATPKVVGVSRSYRPAASTERRERQAPQPKPARSAAGMGDEAARMIEEELEDQQ